MSSIDLSYLSEDELSRKIQAWLPGPNNIVVHAALAELVERARGNKYARGCAHEWVDARNEVIESGEWCPKCNAIRATGGK